MVIFFPSYSIAAQVQDSVKDRCYQRALNRDKRDNSYHVHKTNKGKEQGSPYVQFCVAGRHPYEIEVIANQPIANHIERKDYDGTHGSPKKKTPGAK